MYDMWQLLKVAHMTEEKARQSSKKKIPKCVLEGDNIEVECRTFLSVKMQLFSLNAKGNTDK